MLVLPMRLDSREVEQLTQICSMGKEKIQYCKINFFSLHRFLATGQSFRSLSFNYRIGVKTVASIVEEVCQVIWKQMSGIYMKMPETPKDWKLVA